MDAIGRVADEVGAGSLTPDEEQALCAILETKRRAIETAELEKRVVALKKDRYE
jgi:hypothetical protein